MCILPLKPIDTRIIDRPEAVLAQHFEEATGLHIEPDVLRQFMCENWKTVSDLAHRIHHNHVRRKLAEQRAFEQGATDA